MRTTRPRKENFPLTMSEILSPLYVPPSSPPTDIPTEDAYFASICQPASPYFPPTPVYISHPSSPSDTNDPLNTYFHVEESIWNAMGIEDPPSATDQTPPPQKQHDPFQRNIYLVRPLWMEVKEMEEKISACKESGISSGHAEEMSMPLWGGPGLEGMQRTFDKIKEVKKLDHELVII